MYVTANTNESLSELECGDEIVMLNGEVLLGKTREDIAELIRNGPVSSLQADASGERWGSV